MTEELDALKAHQALEETVIAVLADMVFLDCRSLAALPDSSARTLQAGQSTALTILKPLSLQLELQVGAGFGPLVRHILFPAAATAQPDPSTEADLLLELTNVLAGNFVKRYFGPDAREQFELPRWLPPTGLPDFDEGGLIAEAWFDAEGQALRARLRSIRFRY